MCAQICIIGNSTLSITKVFNLARIVKKIMDKYPICPFMMNALFAVNRSRFYFYFILFFIHQLELFLDLLPQLLMNQAVHSVVQETMPQ